MTVLALAQTIAKRLQVGSPSGLVASTDNNILLVLQMIERTAQELRNEFAWPELQKEWTFTLATSTASYALPGDINRVLFETLWNRTATWPLLGPLDAVEWQQYKSGLVANFPRNRFRIKGYADNQFFVDPTPSSDENGQTCVYEYVTRTVFRPKTWVTSTSFAAGSYSFYNGNIYKTTAGGTTGATPPTHTTGTASDGTVSWIYQSTYFETITADTDECLLDNQIIVDGAIWRFKQERGLDFESLRDQAMRQVALAKSRLQGASVLSMRMGNTGPLPIGLHSYPEQDFG